ncbi:hypothetical protein [Streptomyces violaceusniger]|uniref:hypothetical protein n=1 Tax=Streptomyces violaceusniger TaxID=68280 RepID=UPI0036C89A3F
MTAALDRLVGIVGVPIAEKERKAIKDLEETRNALTHYGHTSNALAVEARAARVLSLLVDFVPKQLYPVLCQRPFRFPRSVKPHELLDSPYRIAA